LKVINTITNYAELKNCALTIGTFDGVHIGHKQIIKRLVKQAKKKDLLSVVLTFFPHPRMILQKESDIRLIDTLNEKQKLLEDLGIDVLVVHPFSKIFSRQLADEFIRNILVNTFHIAHLIIGYDHRFGRNREATIDDLINAGETYGFSVEKIEAQEIASVNVSSTKIRLAIEAGDIQKANNYLNRPFKITGKVIKGAEIGRTIGFPTANLHITEEYKLLPADGVYFVRAKHKGKTIFGMMNIGFRPTVNGKKRSYEVHFFNFNEDLYKQFISVELLDQIRQEKAFLTLDELKQQLTLDKAHCQRLIPRK
jgi:riboflavin kinase/FMN adenylyltransferase